jgi:hypothetical protein
VLCCVVSYGNESILFLGGVDKTPADRAARGEGGGGQTCRRLEFVVKILGVKSASLTEDSILRRSGIILLMVMEEEPVR